MEICVCVRKRPLFEKETLAGEIDATTCSNPKIIVHEPKLKVDGITKYINSVSFNFDNTYSEHEDSSDLYDYQIKDLLPSIFQKGVVTLFAYGQTGSGKTFTVAAATQCAVRDMFKIAPQGALFYMSFFEIYGGKVSDLLNGKKKLQIQEDGNSKIQVSGLTERQASSEKEMNSIIDFGHSERTTHSTAANDTSSRSHAVCQIKVKDGSGKNIGKLLLVDLAGSERAADTQSNNRQRRMEGAEINKSLLALKECIRAIDQRSGHVPFRASKLSMVLRDSFLGSNAKIVMIACINPGSSSADHTLNTLRYAERLKTDGSTNKAYKNAEDVGLAKVQPNMQQAKPAAAKGQHAYKLNKNQSKSQVDVLSHQPPQQKQQQPQSLDLAPSKEKGPNSRSVEGQQKQTQAYPKPAAKADALARVNNQKEERKRAQWGAQANPTNPQPSSVSPHGRPPQNPASAGAARNPANVPQHLQQKQNNQLKANVPLGHKYIETPEMKKAKLDDLKMTLGSGQGLGLEPDMGLVAFHEKVDNIMEEQEQLRTNHLEYLKEVAMLITQQGELISNIQGQEQEDQDIDDYVNKMEKIVTRNL